VVVALAGVLVDVAGVGVSAVIVETGTATFVGFGCTCGDGVAAGGWVAVGMGAVAGVGVGAIVGVGVGAIVGVGVGVQNKTHAELAAWVTATPVMPLSVLSKSR